MISDGMTLMWRQYNVTCQRGVCRRRRPLRWAGHQAGKGQRLGRGPWPDWHGPSDLHSASDLALLPACRHRAATHSDPTTGQHQTVFNSLRSEQKWLLFADDIFKTLYFLSSFLFKCHWILLLQVQLIDKLVIVGPGNSLAPDRRQTIT